MPSVVNLVEITDKTKLPSFRIPKWMKPKQIRELMDGAVSSDEDEDLVHVCAGSENKK